MLEEFKKFILRGNVVDLAVAVIIGKAFGEIVEGLVKHIFMPFVGMFTTKTDFSAFSPEILGVKFGVGTVITTIINFLIISFCLFLVVKGMNKVQKKKDEAPPPPSASEKLLMEIRDLLAKK